MPERLDTKSLTTELGVFFSSGNYLLSERGLSELVSLSVPESVKKDSTQFNLALKKAIRLMNGKYHKSFFEEEFYYNLRKPKY